MEILYASAVEKAANIEIPQRAVYIRTIMAEIQRIMSHLVFIGSFGEDIGNLTGFIWALRERELLMDIVEKISGGRLAPMYICNGGMFYDFPEEIDSEILEKLSKIESKVNTEYKAMFTKNQIFLSRTKGIGVLTQDMIKKYGITGPIARASGIERDLRKVTPVKSCIKTLETLNGTSLSFDFLGSHSAIFATSSSLTLFPSKLRIRDSKTTLNENGNFDIL